MLKWISCVLTVRMGQKDANKFQIPNDERRLRFGEFVIGLVFVNKMEEKLV